MKFFKFLILILTVVLLAACASRSSGRVCCGSGGADDVCCVAYSPEEQRRRLIHKFAQILEREGGELILVGDSIRMIFPEYIVFDCCSSNLNPRYYHLLNDAACLMRRLETISVQVAGYTNCKSTYTLNQALSQRQAEVFAEYLFNKDLDARLVHTVGYGTKNPLVMYIPAPENRRVEITFQYLPLLNQY